MSKPMTRIAVSVLICLVIAVTMFTIAYGASARVGIAGGRVPANAGLTSFVGANRQPVIQSYFSNMEKPAGSGHHCHEESGSDD